MFEPKGRIHTILIFHSTVYLDYIYSKFFFVSQLLEIFFAGCPAGGIQS
jgi:hypothetical protein